MSNDQKSATAVDADALAQLIRSIDGRHSLGAGELAERITEWLAAQPVREPMWQPIETAPKDGTSVLIYRCGEVLPGVAYRNSFGRWYWSASGGWAGYPTHWMPLPAAPSHGICKE